MADLSNVTITSGAPQIITQPECLLRVEPGSRGKTLQVQATGSGLQYQWCKRVSDDPSSPESIDKHIFDKHLTDFQQMVNVDTLCPPLFSAKLITPEQVQELVLEVPGNTNARKIRQLQLWLPVASVRFLDQLIQCLRQGQHLGHLELADSLEGALWTPLSSQNIHYDGVTNSTLILCSVKGAHEGQYRCRVTSSCGQSVLSEVAHVQLIKPDENAVEAFVLELQSKPEKGAELAQTLIKKLQKERSVGYHALVQAIKRCGEIKEVVRAFLASGWSPTEPLEGEGRKTLVHILAEEGHTETLKLILGSCTDEKTAKAMDENRCTPLHLAVKAGRVETGLALLEVKRVQETVSYQDKNFSTALHLAVEQGSDVMVQALLTVPDINLGVLNHENLKAVEVAKNKGLGAIVKIIEEKESRPLVMSPLDFHGGMLGPRSNSYDSNLNRTQSVVSSGYASSAGTMYRSGSLARAEPLHLVGTAERQVMDLQRRLANYKGTLIGKKLIKHGVIRKCNRKGAKKDVYIFLLTDVLLYTKYSDITKKYNVKGELSVRGMEVVAMQEEGQPVVRNEPLSFTVTSKEKALHLVASSPKEKEDWIQALKSAVCHLVAAQPPSLTSSQLLPGAGLGARAPAWVPDTHVTACQLSLCNKKFSVIERKHHCRQCGRVVCNSCSMERRYLTYQQKEGRVCDECIEEFSGRRTTDEADTKEPMRKTERTVMSGYVKRHCGGKTEEKFYKLVNNVLSIFGAHEDTTATHSMILMGYSIQGDQGSYRITLTHHQGKEELNDSFTTPADDYERWLHALKAASKS